MAAAQNVHQVAPWEVNSGESLSEIKAWYARYDICRTYFFDCTQHTDAVIALAKFLNISLPHQNRQDKHQVKLRAYIRRLVATGYATEEIISLWFGRDWRGGLGKLVQQERLNYTLAAMPSNWVGVKQGYDLGSTSTVPFLKELEAPGIEALRSARNQWARMQNLIFVENVRIKREREEE